MGYRTTEIAEVVGLSDRQVRSYVYAGLVKPERGPRHEYRYSFQDLVLLRMGSRLKRSRLSVRRVAAALLKLRDQLPDEQPLSSVEVDALGRTVLVRDGDGVWDPHTGQSYFPFSLESRSEEGAARAAGPLPVVVPLPVASRRVAQTDVESAAWYERALGLEEANPSAAVDAYRQALALDPTDADARANLGRLLHAQGALEDAEAEFRQALRHDPRHATAAFNLGVALQDQDRLEEAREVYDQVLALDPGFAAAHFNLATVCERLDDTAAAVRHLSEYRRHVTER